MATTKAFNATSFQTKTFACLNEYSVGADEILDKIVLETDSVCTNKGNNFHAFDDGSILVMSDDATMTISVFENIHQAVSELGDDPRKLYPDFGVF